MTPQEPETVLRSLAEKATPGPWRWAEKYDWSGQTEGALLTDVPGYGLYDDPPGTLIEPTGHDAEAIRLKVTDAAYIAAASPDRVLRLLDVVAAARTYIDDIDPNDAHEPINWRLAMLKDALDALTPESAS